MSSSLADAVRLRLEQASNDEFVDEEMRHVQPILELQSRWSSIPRRDEVLIETTKTREGHHQYIFPFQGRLVHEGLAALLAFRLGKRGFSPITATFNDYGVELLSPMSIDLASEQWLEILTPENLAEDVLACVNSSELAKRHFREIARIAGLLVPMRPGAPRSIRALQASSELFYDVFREFDPDNLLLDQARREVLERQLEFKRLRSALEKIAGEKIVMITTQRLTPLAFPLWAERIGSQQLRIDGATERIARVVAQLEAAADAQAARSTSQKKMLQREDSMR
jgi:ATP-dependent Lhr-like helicase